MPRLRVMLNEKESAPQLCHHCEDAPCAVVCPVNAITRVDGAVQLNESLCVSCKLCGIACPFGAIEFFRQPSAGYSCKCQYPESATGTACSGAYQYAA